ncbi:unnamed protein product [Penicillium camemberti]|uniref:Str. FM013 n=1 Tax=Penicillium camemberti (strain FM 013) TaxID=1429867 RepID=A0A0G4PXM5_PENC3|nr:unnamed protein product [Penicillium camemberti]
MAITGYFIDINWVYREVLLRFKPLYGAYIGANMSDNISNNKTLVDSLQQALPPEINIIRTPYLAAGTYADPGHTDSVELNILDASAGKKTP